MEFAAEFAVRAKLDVNTLVKTQPYEIQRLLNSAFFFGRHFWLCWKALKSQTEELGFMSFRSPKPNANADPLILFIDPTRSTFVFSSYSFSFFLFSRQK